MPKSYFFGIILLKLVFAYPGNGLFLFYLLIEVVVTRLLSLLIEIQLFYYLFCYFLVLGIYGVFARARDFHRLFLDHVEHSLPSFVLNREFTLAFRSYVNILTRAVA